MEDKEKIEAWKEEIKGKIARLYQQLDEVHRAMAKMLNDINELEREVRKRG